MTDHLPPPALTSIDDDQASILERNPLFKKTSDDRAKDTISPTIVTQQLEHFHAQLRRIEDMERRIECRAVAVRRRMATLLERSSTTRDSHLRLYVSHSYQPEITPAGAMAALMGAGKSNSSSIHVKPSPPRWTVHIEGRLLIEDLLRAGSVDFDQRVHYQPQQDDIDRSRGEEDDGAADVTNPLKTTNLFDTVKVTFQTVYAPGSVSANSNKKLKVMVPPSLSKKAKSSRRSSSEKGSPATVPESGIESDERVMSLKHQIVWKRGDTDDSADLWSFQYLEPPPPVQHQDKWHSVSVTANIELYRRTQYVTAVSSIYQQPVQQYCEEHTPLRYCIQSLELQRALFPHHGPETSDLLTGKKRNHNLPEGNDEHTPPSHNEVHIPSTLLTMTEIAQAFFTYIRDRKLVQTQDHVISDNLLKQLLGMEQFSFSQLQVLLQREGLVKAMTEAQEPVRITYIMERDAASALGQPFADTEDAPDLSLLQFDIDVAVPQSLGYRIRELMRRVKRRELEYTSSRPKARYSLPTGDSGSNNNSSSSNSNYSSNNTNQKSKDEEERVVRQRMEQAASQTSLDEALIPLHLALAKAAPPESEARSALYLEAQLSYMVERLQKENLPKALMAQHILEIVRESSGM